MSQALFAAVLLGTVLLACGLEAARGGRRRRVLDVLLRLEEERVAQIHGARVAAALRRSAAGALRRLLERLVPLARLGPGGGGDIARRLVWAGVGITAEQFSALRLLAAVLGALGGVGGGALLRSADASVACGCLGSIIGFAAPESWLAASVARRHRAIDRELLYFLDFLALAARAGLGLDAALEHVCREYPGLLSAEFAQVRAERGMGQWTEHALAGLAERLGHREVRGVAEALTRAGRFGSRTAPLLRQMAGSIRAQRNLAAREHANRAGAAIILPVAAFILPAVIIILGYPAVATVTGVLGAR